MGAAPRRLRRAARRSLLANRIAIATEEKEGVVEGRRRFRAASKGLGARGARLGLSLRLNDGGPGRLTRSGRPALS